MKINKANFVVSALYDIWLPDSKNLFLSNSYIEHLLKFNRGPHSYQGIEVARDYRSTKEEFESDHNFVDAKYHEYQKILSKRLDELHEVNFGDEFWQKAMGLGLLRHKTFCYDLFRVCDQYLDSDSHDCQILSPKSFSIPKDFDAHRKIFQHTELGQEQLFSIYCNLFHTGKFKYWDGNYTVKTDNKCRGRFALLKARLISIRGYGMKALNTLWHEPNKIFFKLISQLISIRSPKIGILACGFAPEHQFRLTASSMGAISGIKAAKFQIFNSPICWEDRERLAHQYSDLDKFDRFVFASLKYSMPKMLVEDFDSTYLTVSKHFKKYKSLRWVLCEHWIGQSLTSFSLAVLSRLNVKNITNDHNYLSYFFLGSSIKYHAQLSDEFLTLGWKDSSIPNLTPGSSLFPWVLDKKSQHKDIDILLICGLPVARQTEITCACGDHGSFGAKEYLKMNDRFFSKLGDKTLSEIYCRGYPAKMVEDIEAWDFFRLNHKHIQKMKVYDDYSKTSKELMVRAKLIIINYLSTAYLEALMLDTPCVFIWNKDTNMLSDKYGIVFDSLIRSGICQQTLKRQPTLLIKSKKNPEAWWRSSAVKESRKTFLEENIREPELMINYLLSKIKN